MSVFSKKAMAGASDQLRAVMNDIIDKAQQLAKNKIATLPIAANQPVGPPTIMTNPPVQQQMVAAEDKAAKKKTSTAKQQYPHSDTREYTDSKSRRQAHLDKRENLREERQMESAKRDMLVFKQMIFKLKSVLVMEKDKKVKKALQQEIFANEDIVQTMIRSGIPDVPLLKDIQLQITTERGKKTA